MLKLFMYFVIFKVEEVLKHYDELTVTFNGVRLVRIKHLNSSSMRW